MLGFSFSVAGDGLVEQQAAEGRCSVWLSGGGGELLRPYYSEGIYPVRPNTNSFEELFQQEPFHTGISVFVPRRCDEPRAPTPKGNHV